MCEDYYKNGQLRLRCSYSHGGLIGTLEGYHENGQLAIARSCGSAWCADEKEERYDSNGKLIYKRTFSIHPLYDESGFIIAGGMEQAEEEGIRPNVERWRVNVLLKQLKSQEAPSSARRLACRNLVREYRAKFAHVLDR